MINIDKLIGGAYYEVFHSLEKREKSTYWFKGGRGSLKGSFVYIYTILDLTRDAQNKKNTHCVGLRKVKETIRDSIFANLIWAINLLGVNHLWEYTVSPMRIYHKYNGNTILFRGCANKTDFEKIKSLKFVEGFCKIAIFEELPEFSGMDEISNIQESLFRGGDESLCFMMYNPPPSKKSWVNLYCRELESLEKQGINTDVYIHHTTYLQAPESWLGKPFIKKAEFLKRVNFKKYRHVYLGEEIGEGLEIYPNTIVRPFTNEEISKFDRINRGLDFGLTCSPLVA